jgi:ribosomal protein S4E
MYFHKVIPIIDGSPIVVSTIPIRFLIPLSFQTVLQLSSSQFLKHFEIGARVKICRGENVGKIGTIVKVKESERSATLASGFVDSKGWPTQFNASLNHLTYAPVKAELEMAQTT